MRHYRENYLDSRKLAERVLEETAKRRIRPNPINFTVWYEFLLERDPHIFDTLSQTPDHEHDEVAKDLFNHIVSRLCFMSEIESVVLKLVNELIGDIDGWENNLESHAAILETALGALVNKASNSEAATMAVQEIIGCVKDFTCNAESIKHKMEAVKSEVDELKK